METNFIENYQADVSKIIEKKNNLDYISWAYAQKMAMELDEDFSWHMVETQTGELLHNGMVLLEMFFLGKTYRHHFPVLDYRNKAIEKPNAFDINTAQMRGMTKMFSMYSGYGLSLYTGEDIRNLDDVGLSNNGTQQSNTSNEKQGNAQQQNKKTDEDFVSQDFNNSYKAIINSGDNKKIRAMKELFGNANLLNETKKGIDPSKLSKLSLVMLKEITVALVKIETREV